MRATMILCMLMAFSGCAGNNALVMTRDNSKQMRTYVVGDEQNALLVTEALWHSGQWYIVDRGTGFEAALTEQRRVHIEEGDRFDAHESYAEIGKLYSVGAIVVAQDRCVNEIRLFSASGMRCDQFLTVVEASTGEILVAVRNLGVESDRIDAKPFWDETVKLMNDALPKEHRVTTPGPQLLQEREMSAKRSKHRHGGPDAHKPEE